MARNKALRLLGEPFAINAAQVAGYSMAGGAGLLAAIGGAPTFLTGTIGPLLSVGVGSTLVIGGVIGTIAVLAGHWWMERVALLITGLGWALLLPAAVFFALSPRSSGGIWLVVALVVVALCDVFKRYQRISWAYLDPARGLRRD